MLTPLPSRFSRQQTLKAAFAVLFTVSCVEARAIDEDDDFFPGLMAQYTSNAHSVRRIDDVLSFDWGVSAPDTRLQPGAFTAQWSGKLLARTSGQHTFHVFVAGTVVIKIDEHVVLDTSQQWGFDSGNSFALSAGDHDLRVSYSTPQETDKPRARLNVFWSSDAFTLEPLPADILFREEGDSQVRAADHGGQLFDAFRCAACHQSAGGHDNAFAHSGADVLQAPALDRVRGSQTKDTLIERLLRPAQAVGNTHMPDFGFTSEEAITVADFLLSVSKDAHKESKLAVKDGDADAGRLLLNSLGCVACHQLPEAGLPSESLADPYDAPELVNIGSRRSSAWLDRWLRDPGSLNADHRMPVFDLSKDERRQIVASLSMTVGKAGHQNASPRDALLEERTAAGRKLVVEANCAACHKIPNIKKSVTAAITPDGGNRDAQRDCFLNPSPPGKSTMRNGKRIPSFPGLEGQQTVSLMEWIRNQDFFGTPGGPDVGQLLLRRKGCTACHDRNGDQGISAVANQLQNAHPSLKRQSQGLIPPSLTAVGDKLNDSYLNKAVAGEQPGRRLPWLLVRMPKFNHSETERSALVQHFMATDRIPDAADAARQDVLANVDPTDKSPAATVEELLLGNQLTGAGGFNCVACHKAGPFEPRNVALGTRGSDIMTMGSRIRPRFFHRWMKNPIRVQPGIEMPAIKKAMPGVLGDSLPKQIGILWKSLSDKRFTPPTVTSRFEQVVNVERGASARIIRDVFTIGTDKSTFQPVARAFAVGFENGHNILLDLDTMTLRLWTMGEFARQRTEGKSWFWDMPGAVVNYAHGFRGQLKFVRDGKPIAPVEDEGRRFNLIHYRSSGNSVKLTVDCWFDFSGSTDVPVARPVHSAITAWNDSSRPLQKLRTRHVLATTDDTVNGGKGWSWESSIVDGPEAISLAIRQAIDSEQAKLSPAFDVKSQMGVANAGRTIKQTHVVQEDAPVIRTPNIPVVKSDAVAVTSTPGFVGTRLPISMSTMPTAMTWLTDGRLAFTSLKGHVWIASDSDADGVPDTTTLLEEGLSAPFGILTDGESVLVAHKPEILRLRDSNGDGRSDQREVVSSGWGYNDNYHDWASGLTRDDKGNLYVGLGSDYSQKDRPPENDRWRGGVIRIDPSGIVTPLGMSMRYPMDIAIDGKGRIFATDNQGVQNTFNEINHILPGKHYGVPSAHQPINGLNPEIPAVMVPHPWTRSVNSILFLPDDFPVASLRGHGIGCEYDSRFLIRFTIQDVNGTLQGATYRFSLPDQEAGKSNFIGPICSAVAPEGELYIGSIWDSGWQGGQNTGGITRLVPSSEGLPNGIRQVTATKTGFEVEFFQPVDDRSATDLASWSIQGYTRKWGGSYATPDSGRRTLKPETISITNGNTRVQISVDDLKPGHVYDLSVTGPLAESSHLWPSEAHYSMKVVPE